MIYSIYQIRLSDSVVNRINSGENVPEYTAYLDSTFGKYEKAMELNMYSKVAEISANSLDEVFEIGNIGPEDRIKRIRPMHSVSVGDMIEDESGKRVIVDRVGFKDVE